MTITHDALPLMFRDPPSPTCSNLFSFDLTGQGPYIQSQARTVDKRVVGILLEHFLVKDLSVHAEIPVVFLDVVKECLAFPVIVKRHHGATEREEWL